MKVLLIFFILSFFVSCSLGDGRDYSYQDTMNVIYEYNKKLSKEKSIELCAYALDYAGKDKIYDGKIHVLDLAYSVDKRIQYKEAKELFYEIVDGLLEKINNTEYLRKYFYHYPVGYEDLYFRLIFHKDGGSLLKTGDVLHISVMNNKILINILEEDGEVRAKYREINPNIFILEDFFSKILTITEQPHAESK